MLLFSNMFALRTAFIFILWKDPVQLTIGNKTFMFQLSELSILPGELLLSYLKHLTRFMALGVMALLLLTQVPPAVSQLALPTGVTFVDSGSQLRAGGSVYTVVVQLLTNDAYYPRPGTGVYFTSSDDSLVDIPIGAYTLTDDQGRAYYNITTGTGPGNVTITAILLTMNGNMRASKTYTVIGMGNISGMVTDSSGRGIPNATVTLYQMSNGTRGPKADVPSVSTADPATGTPGQFTINDVPYGTYYLEAGIDGHISGTATTLAGQNASVTLSIEGYTVATPTPEPTPTSEPTAVPTPSGKPTTTPGQGTGNSTSQAVWIIIVALLVAAIVVAVQLNRMKKGKK